MRRNHYVDEYPHAWSLPVVPMGDALNPFVDDNVQFFAVLGYELPYETMKSLAVLGLLLDAKERGMIDSNTVLVEATSGATGNVLAPFALAQPFGVKEVVLVMNDDVPLGKKYPPYFAGARIIPPEDGMSGIATARALGGGGWKPDNGWEKSENNWLNLDQYANLANARLYRELAAPKIVDGIVGSKDKLIVVAPVGTGGTGIGLGAGIRERSEGAVIVGARCAPQQEIPGVRDIERMKEISLPWRDAFDDLIDVDARPSYYSMLWLNWTDGFTPGVSGGMDLVAALSFLKKRKDEEGSLDSLRGKDGLVKVAVVIHDGWRPYLVDRLPSFVHRDHQKPSTAPKPWELLWGKTV